MMKNLTVNMPLAVPTQKRPPGKYASHPYPVLVENAYKATPLTAISAAITKVYHTIRPQEDYGSQGVNAKSAMLKQVYFYKTLVFSPEDYGSQGVNAKSAALKQVYFYKSNQIADSYLSGRILSVSGALTRVYFYLKHTQPEEKYSSKGVRALSAKLKRMG